MKTALIVTSHIEHPELIDSVPKCDIVISADGGYLYAEHFGLSPDVYIGDHDSAKLPPSSMHASNIILPENKDMTDGEAAIDYCVKHGYDDITVVGGMGGRVDHTLGNISMLAKYCGKLKISFIDGQNRILMVSPGTYTIPKSHYDYLSLIAYGEPVTGLEILGCKYELSAHTLNNITTLGVSNEIIDSKATITFETGKLLIVESRNL